MHERFAGGAFACRREATIFMVMDETIPRELVEWVERSAGLRVVQAKRALSGGSRTTWLLETDDIGPRAGLVVRVESGSGAFANTDLSFEREAVLYRALRQTSVPIPELVALSDDGRTMLTTRALGRENLQRESEDLRRATLMRYAKEIAGLHRLDPAKLALKGFVHPGDVRAHALNEVSFWEKLARSRGAPDLELEYAFAWLAANPPTEVTGTALIHGDCGPGNFLYDDGKITALIDWEFAHIGDPIDDMAWLEFRILRDGGSQQLADDVIAHYATISGRAVNPQGLQYYRCLVLLRCAVTAALSLASGGAMGGAAYRRAHRRLLRDMLLKIADIVRVEVVVPALDSRLSSPSAMMEDALRNAQALVAMSRGAAKLHSIWLEWAVRYLRNRETHGGEVDAANQRDIACAVLSQHPSDDERRAAVAAAGSASDAAVLGALARCAARNDWMWTGDQPGAVSEQSGEAG